MKRDWSGCERRRSGTAIADPQCRAALAVRCLLRLRACLSVACPEPDRSARRLTLPSTAIHPALWGRCRQKPLNSDTGEVIIIRQAAGNRGRVVLSSRPALGATDGQRIPRNTGEPREAASQGVGLRPGQGGAASAARSQTRQSGRRDQASSARRSSTDMRASTSHRTSGPAWWSMARQSSILRTVATVPRIVS